MNTAIPNPPPPSAENFVYRSRRGATLYDVREAMKSLKAALLKAEVPQLDVSCVEIVVAEILNNIVKHAQRDLEQGWFEIQCSFIPKGMHFVCRDNGAPMPGGAPPGGPLPNVDRQKDELPEGGWGWSLVRTLATNLSYVRLQEVNLVSFNLPRSPSR